MYYHSYNNFLITLENLINNFVNIASKKEQFINEETYLRRRKEALKDICNFFENHPLSRKIIDNKKFFKLGVFDYIEIPDRYGKETILGQKIKFFLAHTFTFKDDSNLAASVISFPFLNLFEKSIKKMLNNKNRPLTHSEQKIMDDVSGLSKFLAFTVYNNFVENKKYTEIEKQQLGDFKKNLTVGDIKEMPVLDDILQLWDESSVLSTYVDDNNYLIANTHNPEFKMNMKKSLSASGINLDKNGNLNSSIISIYLNNDTQVVNRDKYYGQIFFRQDYYYCPLPITDKVLNAMHYILSTYGYDSSIFGFNDDTKERYENLLNMDNIENITSEDLQFLVNCFLKISTIPVVKYTEITSEDAEKIMNDYTHNSRMLVGELLTEDEQNRLTHYNIPDLIYNITEKLFLEKVDYMINGINEEKKRLLVHESKIKPNNLSGHNRDSFSL